MEMVAGVKEAGAVSARQKLQSALLDMCQEQDFFRVSVSELCSQAGVSRKTFYKHYQSTDELARIMIDATFGEALRSVPVEGLEYKDELPVVRHVLTAFCNDFHRISAIQKAFGTDLVLSVVQPISDQTARKLVYQQGVDEDFLADYISTLATGLAMATLRTWMERGGKDDVDQLVRLISTLFGPGFQNLRTHGVSPD